MKSKEVITIGLVDDHDMVRDSLKRLLNNVRDFNVIVEADSGMSFFEKLEEDNLPDIAIVDISMKGMLGFEVVRRLTDNYPSVKSIALTMSDHEIKIIRMFRNGARGYVLKGSKPSELKDAIRRVYKAGYFSNSVVSEVLISEATKGILALLNEDELKFINYSCSEVSYREIAKNMGLSPRTIDGYRERVYAKLKVSTRVGLVLWAIRNGVFDAE